MPDQPAPRRSKFAVWSWMPRWVWIAATVVSPVAYFLTVSPAAYFVCRCGGVKNAVVANAVDYATLPANILVDKSKLYRKLTELEWDAMCVLFGDVDAPGMRAL